MATADAGDVPLIAKLERPLALEHLEEILRACDAVMVARGDLGLEMPLERVPRAQKEITRGARLAGMPVIVATQVLESMTERGAADPRRGERRGQRGRGRRRRDHARRRDGGRRASRRAPCKTLDAIIRDAESAPPHDVRGALTDASDADHAQALCEAAVTLADRGDAAGDRRGDPRRHDGARGCRRCGRARRSSPPPSATDTARRLTPALGRRAALHAESATTSTRPARGSARSSSSAAWSSPAPPPCSSASTPT